MFLLNEWSSNKEQDVPSSSEQLSKIIRRFCIIFTGLKSDQCLVFPCLSLTALSHCNALWLTFEFLGADIQLYFCFLYLLFLCKIFKLYSNTTVHLVPVQLVPFQIYIPLLHSVYHIQTSGKDLFSSKSQFIWMFNCNFVIVYWLTDSLSHSLTDLFYLNNVTLANEDIHNIEVRSVLQLAISWHLRQLLQVK